MAGKRLFTVEKLQAAIEAGAKTRMEVAAKLGCSSTTLDSLLKSSGIALVKSTVIHDARRERVTEAVRVWLCGCGPTNDKIKVVAERLDVSPRTAEAYLVVAGLLPSHTEALAVAELMIRRLWHRTNLEQQEIAAASGVNASWVTRHLKDEPPRGEWKETA